ncbi:peptide ABC transporter substrate-binding protein [Tissierella carlieri]|uniref:Peptide ABC transporter substrate-binding protein n=1 Tax=Tissierella carlieri TaxID=689904 RepID=A0ABT1S9H6_9FIRM|nr:peptide ABC transporter substrate-binding protein [Tissierella carlieri]MCQ4923125.1 peptide ABC transporter substrate-binding protein [Tissierella carlieri]
MNKKFLMLVSLLLITAIIFTGCVPKGGDAPKDTGSTPATTDTTPAPTPAEPKILKTNNSSEPGSLDPALAQGTHESWILDHTFEGLMKVDPNLKVVPGMAKEYKISDDNLTYTFTLRDDIKWSNGDPVTAHDFEFAWKRALDPDMASDYAHQLYYIKGGEAYNTGAGSVDDVAVKALDDKTLEVTLEAPTAYFLELTAFYTLYPVNKKVAESNADWAKNANTHVSNGPFTLTEWEHNASIKIRKNENYYDVASVKLDGIDFDIIDDENTAWQKYEGGDYDFLTPLPQAVVAQMKDNNNPELIIGADVATYYYNLNSKVKPFNNAKVRKGLSMTLDRQTIVDKIAQGGQIAAVGVVPFGLPDENGKDYREAVGDLIEYNVEEGKKLFLEGLAEEGMKVEDFKNMVILYNTSEAHKKIAQAAQEMWRVNLGVEIQLENVDFQVKLDREKAGDYHISRAGWIGDYMDPITFIELWQSSSSFNDAKYNNPEYDELVAIAKTSPDAKERFEAMRKAEKIVMEDMPVVPVYFYTQPYAQKPYVTGVYKPLVNYPKLTYADINK